MKAERCRPAAWLKVCLWSLPLHGLAKGLNPTDLWWTPIHLLNSDWFHLQIHWFVDSKLHIRTCLFQAVIIPNRTLSIQKKILGHELSAWWECKIKPDFCLINRNLKPPNALRNVWVSDCILNQYEKLTLSFRSTFWLTQDWWSDIDLCTKNAINECLNWLIQSLFHPHRWFFFFQDKLLNYLLPDQHTTHRWTQIRNRDYHLLWNKSLKLIKFQFLRIFDWTMACHSYFLSGWKLGHLEEPIHSEFHGIERESFWRWSRYENLFWNLIENFARDSTACRCTPYSEVEFWGQ